MAVINFARREIITKIVYFGAPGAGATSNLRGLYARTDGDTQGPLLPFGPEDHAERTLFFEVRPRGVELPGFALRVRLYSLPGGLEEPSHRLEVCRELDAAVFVADARPGRNDTNIEALLDLDRLLKDLDLELSSLPMVFQVNHTDQPAALPTEQVVYDLNPYGHPVVPATASDGQGVLETLEHVLGMLTERIRDNLAGRPTQLQVHAIHRQEALTPKQIVTAHERAIHLAQAEKPGPETSTAPATWSRSRYDILPAGPSVEVPYQPPELVGMRPIHVLDTRVDRDRVKIDLVMDDQEGAHPTRLRVMLVPPGREATPTAPQHPTGTVPAQRPRPESTATLPERIEIVSARAAADSHAEVWYGVAGAVGGIIAGLLLGFLIWA